jgi:hypothetical protein
MKNKSNWHRCGSKHRYRYEHDANISRKKYEKERGNKLRVYYCYDCNGFHLTSTIAHTYEIDY